MFLCYFFTFLCLRVSVVCNITLRRRPHNNEAGNKVVLSEQQAAPVFSIQEERIAHFAIFFPPRPLAAGFFLAGVAFFLGIAVDATASDWGLFFFFADAFSSSA